MSNMMPIPNEDVHHMAEKEESRFLNIILRDKTCLSDAISFGIKFTEDKTPGHFLMPKNNVLYKIIHQNFIKHGTLLTRSAMDSIVDRQDTLTEEEKASLKGYWDKIWNRHDVAIEDYSLLKDHINDRYILWQFYNIWKNGDNIVKSTSGHSDLVRGFIKDLNSMDNMNPDPYSKIMSIEEGVKLAMQYAKDRREHPENNDVLFTNIEGIDKVYHGFAKGSYTVISGMINGGKTTLMMNIGFNMAKAGYNVAYVSLEKDAKLFFRRILALHAKTDYNRIKTGGNGSWGLTDFWFQKLKDAEKDLVENIKPHYDCLQFVQNTKLTRILSEIDRLIVRKGKLDVLIVDYLQVIGNETNHPTRPDLDLAEIHKRLMAYGRTNKLAVFTALQLKSSSSKEIRKKAEKVSNESQLDSVSVNTEDYSGSQMIIADADNALGVVLNGDKPPSKMFISISKARDDESRKTICLDFNGRIGSVTDPEYGEGRVKAVDSMLYDKNMTEEKLANEEGLFEAVEEKIAPSHKGETKVKHKEESKTETPKSQKEKDSFVDDLRKESQEDDKVAEITESESSSEEPKEKVKGLDHTEIPVEDNDENNNEDIFKI